MTITRICKTCKNEKLLIEFPVRVRFMDGSIQYRWKCIECAGEWRKRHYLESDKAKRAQERRNYRNNGDIHGIKRCTKCKEEKSIGDFPFKNKKQGNLKRKAICRKCLAEIQQKWNEENREVQVGYAKKYYAKKCRFKHALQQSEGSAKRGKYTPCIASIEQVKETFTGKCHVCGVNEGDCKRRLNLDHCHLGGVFRGWLCDNCNRALGHLKDSSEIIENLFNYIKE